MALFPKLCYQLERFDHCVMEIRPLGADHYAEVVTHSPGEYALDEELYQSIENNGNLRLFTARDQLGILRGYCAFLVNYDPHSHDTLVATEDSIYIEPSFRGNGRSFIEYQDDYLAHEGINRIYRHVPLTSRHGKILERTGYAAIQQLYVKLNPEPQDI